MASVYSSCLFPGHCLLGSEKIPIEKPNLFQYLMYVTFRSFIMINVYISYFWCCWHNPKIGCCCLQLSIWHHCIHFTNTATQSNICSIKENQNLDFCQLPLSDQWEKCMITCTNLCWGLVREDFQDVYYLFMASGWI